MTVTKTRRATILLCSVAVAAFATSALARPVHHHRHAQTTQGAAAGAERDVRYSFNAAQAATATAGDTVVRSRRQAACRGPMPAHRRNRIRLRPTCGATSDALVE